MFSEVQYDAIKELAEEELNNVEGMLLTDLTPDNSFSNEIISILCQPSKRLRVVLPILWIKSLAKPLTKEQLEVLSVIEVIHNASLIHDDIIDKCEVRRNSKTISSIFGDKMGVVAGDYLLSIAMDRLCKLGNLEIIQKLTSTIKNMCLGEINQYNNKFKLTTIDEYIEKSKDKTASLFETAFTCCGIIGNLDFESLSNFGLNVGLAYQIRDDIENIKDTTKSKPTGNDYSDGIYTAPIILGNKDDNYNGGIEKAKFLLNNYLSKAFAELKFLPNNKYRQGLENFLELLKDV